MAPAQRRLSGAGGLVLVLGLSVGGCTRRATPVAPAAVPVASSTDVSSSAVTGGAGGAPADDDGIRPLRRCFSELPPWIDPPVADVLDQAGRFLDEEDFEG